MTCTSSPTTQDSGSVPNKVISIKHCCNRSVLITTAELFTYRGRQADEGELAEAMVDPMAASSGDAGECWTRVQLPSGETVFLELVTDEYTSVLPFPITVPAREGFTLTMTADALVPTADSGEVDDD